MKTTLAVVSLMVTAMLLRAEDAVDAAKAIYDANVKMGVLRLNTAHIEELKKIKQIAMKNSDLTTANKADLRITEMQEASDKLAQSNNSTQFQLSSYPSNGDYKMISSNGQIYSENGNEIICKFQRVSRLDAAKGTLVLTIIANSIAYSNSPNDILILNSSKGREIGKIKGIGRGQTIRVPLTLSISDSVEIVVVNRGPEAVFLKPFKEKVPEMYLEIIR